LKAGSGETLGWLLVSNPWREAIEAGSKPRKLRQDLVSNPWREAIEVLLLVRLCSILVVSNPWREAIEEKNRII